MYKGKILIIDILYVEEIEAFNEKGEDFSLNETKCHYVYESDSTLVVFNKQKFDKRERSSAGSRSSLRFNRLGKLVANKCLGRAKSKKVASNDVTKMNEGSGEAVFLPIKLIHSLSNMDHQRCISGIRGSFQRAAPSETLDAVDGLTN